MTKTGMGLLASLGSMVLVVFVIPLLGKKGCKAFGVVAALWLVGAVIVSVAMGIFGPTNMVLVLFAAPAMAAGCGFAIYELSPALYGILTHRETMYTGVARIRVSTYAMDGAAQENRRLAAKWGAIVICLASAGVFALMPADTNSPTKQELATAKLEVLPAGTAIHDGRFPDRGVWGILRSDAKVRVYREKAVEGVDFRFIEFTEEAWLDDRSSGSEPKVHHLLAGSLMTTPKLPAKR